MGDDLTPRTTGAQALARVIAASPDPFLVGLPGGHTVAIFDAIRDLPGITTVLAREESIATVIAENHGRSTGHAPVVMAQGAWLLGVGGAGIMEAHLASSPLVVVTDTTESNTFSHLGAYQAAFGGYGAYDLPAALAAITKRTFVATSPVQAVEMLQLAYLHATTGEPGPVALVLHSQAILGELGEHAARLDLTRPLTPLHPTPDADALASAAAAIAGAERPVVLVGNGARLGASAVQTFVERCEIPYVSTSGGKGVLPEDAPLAAGVIGNFGHDLANRTLGEADVVIVFGSKLSATDTIEANPQLLDGRRQTVIQVDVEPLNLGWTTHVTHRLLGRVEDVAAGLGSLVDASFGGVARVADLRSTTRHLAVPELASGDRLNPRAVTALLAELLPAASAVSCDAGENRLFMLHDYVVRAGGSIVQPNGGGAMGHAVPAAIAATYARPDQFAVAVLGDGGFAMSIHALMTAVENDRHLLAVVLDNTALGWVANGQGDRPFMSHFADFDLTAIAASLGAVATRAADRAGIERAVAAAIEGHGVHVLVVPVTMTESFLSVQTELAVASHEQLQPQEEQ